MRKIFLAAATLVLAFAGTAGAQNKPTIKIFMHPSSTVPTAEVMKHLVNKCPNVTITLDSKKSDFMVRAGGWSGNYQFVVYRHGGNAAYSTETALLSNAVKDVCKYMNSPQASAASD